MNGKVPDILLSPRRKLLRHAVIQAVALLISSTMLWDDPDVIMADRYMAWLLYFLQIDIAIYGNMFVLVPRLLMRGRTVWYFISLLLLILGSIISIALLQPPTDNPAMGNVESIPPMSGMLSGLLAFYSFVVGLTAMQLLKYRIENIRKIDALKNATMAVELSNLQNQINPHFLFNILNNANIMAGEDAEKSAFILSKLNDLLHYQIEEGSKKAILLHDDIAFLDDYLALEKLRRDRFDYTITVEGPVDVEVPPLLFIPFVENAVKHNPDSGSWVHLSFRIEAGRLRFDCENPKAASSRTAKHGGIGLVNIKRRLGLLYEKNHTLTLDDGEGKYKVTMEIGL